jgi:hypothetical protein
VSLGELIDALDPQLLEPERDPDLARAIRALPPRRRLMVFLRYFADLSYAEIAEACDVSEPGGGGALTLEHTMTPDLPPCCRISRKHELIFDRATSTSLASRMTHDPGDELPPAIDYHLYLEQAIVASINTRS